MKNKMMPMDNEEMAEAPSSPGVPTLPLKPVVRPMPLKPVGPAMGMQGKPMSLTTTKNVFHPNPFGRKPK